MVEIRPIEDEEEGEEEEGKVYGEGFESSVLRNRFIRKVYSILTLQLSFTTVVVAIFVFSEPVKEYVHSHPLMMRVALGIFFVTYFMLVCPCCMTIRRSWPTNIIVLIIFTISLTFLVSVTATMYAPLIVFAALSATVVITFGLTIFAVQTKHDFTSCAGCICMISIFFMAFSIVVSIIFYVNGYSKILDMVYAGLGCLLMMIYIVFHTQMVVGGKRENQLSPEEYIFATTVLYLDIVNLFMLLMRLMGGGRGGNQ